MLQRDFCCLVEERRFRDDSCLPAAQLLFQLSGRQGDGIAPVIVEQANRFERGALPAQAATQVLAVGQDEGNPVAFLPGVVFRAYCRVLAGRLSEVLHQLSLAFEYVDVVGFNDRLVRLGAGWGGLCCGRCWRDSVFRTTAQAGGLQLETGIEKRGAFFCRNPDGIETGVDSF